NDLADAAHRRRNRCERWREFFGRHGVVSTTAPRMTPTHATRSEPASFHRAINTNGLRRISGTGRREATTRAWPEKRAQRRRYGESIDSHGQKQKVLCWIH